MDPIPRPSVATDDIEAPVRIELLALSGRQPFAKQPATARFRVVLSPDGRKERAHAFEARMIAVLADAMQHLCRTASCPDSRFVVARSLVQEANYVNAAAKSVCNADLGNGGGQLQLRLLLSQICLLYPILLG